MKIALLGYGKMGKMIEEVAIDRGHEVILRVDADNRQNLTAEMIQKADVVIEFTAPDSAVENIIFCLDAGTPVIVGTTGWYKSLDEIRKTCESKKGSLVYASNFSLGVNILFALNKTLAKWMSNHPDYTAAIEEVHHNRKLDAPSGTAITLAEGVLDSMHLKGWQEYPMGTGDVAEDTLPVFYERRGEVPGIHSVKYRSAVDELEIRHEAFNRKGFALGAVIAAEFIQGKKGIFTAADVFGVA